MPPFGGYDSFSDCVKKTKRKNPTWSTERASAYCAAIERHITEARKKK